MQKHIVPLGCLFIALTVLLWSGINPLERGTWWMEIAPVLVVLPLLVATYRNFRLSNLLYILIALHVIILCVGGHYTYARVPLFDMLRDYFHQTRNSFDGIGHFAQGFVPAIAARELLLRTSSLQRGKWMWALIVLGCLGISALYEIIEWGAALFSSEGAESFLGTQGDVWDTQKDMALAGIGALLGLALLGKLHDSSLSKLSKGKTP